MKVMGIDLGIHKVAYSYWVEDELRETNAQHFDHVYHRHHELYDISDYIACQLVGLWPDIVIFEDVLIGNNRKYSMQLAETKGAVLAGMGQLSDHNWVGQVIPVNVGTWKKAVIGDGHADKEAVRNYLLSRGSAYYELCDGDQDQFDAACIGYYGLILSRRADKLLEGSR